MNQQPSIPVPIITEQEAASVVKMVSFVLTDNPQSGDDNHLSDDDLLKEATNSDNDGDDV